MSYRFVDGLTVADIAFEAQGASLEELFSSAGMALIATEVENVDQIEKKISRPFQLNDGAVDMLLFNFLQDLIYWKDVDQLIFGVFNLSIEKKDGIYYLTGSGRGEEIDPTRHRMQVDVKAVTLHQFRVVYDLKGWAATVILDI
jgi:SHS2 domain-containing protein